MAVQTTRRKAMGVHYTPGPLAKLAAQRVLRHAEFPATGALRVLDPACGDGALLRSLVDELPYDWTGNAEVWGVEADPVAAAQARSRLLPSRHTDVHVIHGDFLASVAEEHRQGQLWKSEESHPPFFRAFDIVIANPPYVRTQVLGAQTSQRLAVRFGLTGRVDLYHAFWVAMTEALRLGGVLGIITSNRFLSTLAGASLRRFLARAYIIEELIDLGDTKLFDAAILPAIFIGRRRGAEPSQRPSGARRFVKVYASEEMNRNGNTNARGADDIYAVINEGKPGTYRVGQTCFDVTTGTLEAASDPRAVWALTSPDESAWLDQVRAGADGVLADLAKVHVGVKTTADEVFIGSDWEKLPDARRPEETLLHPLLGHENARRWVPTPNGIRLVRILYPHTVVDGLRQAIDLDDYPRARAYFESHHERLASRKYVLDAGRKWYEIWVPQDPAGWGTLKIVFPDISPGPRFYLDRNGHVVDGDSYWITLRAGVAQDMIYLLLGLANSRLMRRYHDLAFNNRLYSSRRRYFAQYVSRYPLPRLPVPATQRLTDAVKECVRESERAYDPDAVRQFETTIDDLVDQAFGVSSDGEFG